jgi:class 3 adenylate cyclase/tetratricopeptide (TPR) repeat protein
VDRFASPAAYTPKHLTEKILTSKHALVGERKQVTVLFCDLVGSTTLAERIGAEAMHAFLGRFFELALAEVHRYEGTINQFLGDGFMALFGAPVAHEDHARRAVLAALAIQRARREQRADLVPADPGAVAVRMGVNTGLVVVGAIGDNLRMDYTAVGDTTNLAARLQQLATPDTVLVADATARLVRGYVRLESLGPTKIQGKREPVVVHRAVGLGSRRSPLGAGEERPLSPLAGRERELATLYELLRLAEDGQGQVVGLVGEPGVGKSRLLLEFRHRLAERRLTWLEGRCVSFGTAIPYLPLIEIIQTNCGIADTDTPEAIEVKVRAGLAEVGLPAETTAAYLLHLLGVKEGTETIATLSPEVIKARTFLTLREMSLKGSRLRPIVFVGEDLHWVDRTTEEYLVGLVESLVGAPILLLTTYRPGYRPPWIEKSFATQITLRPLTSEEGRSLVRGLSAERPISPPLADEILSKAEGNPFFLEELTRAVVEGGERGVVVPDTIQAVLTARIDRLPEETKAVLQTASVLGRQFSPRLLEQVWDGDVLTQHLDTLKQFEFLYERVGAEDAVWVFKHALTQDVAYESLLQDHRRRIHRRIVKAIERLHADRLAEHVERLAHHTFHADMWDEAVAYAHQAARKSFARSAHRECVAMLDQALAALEHLPDGEAKLATAIDVRFDLRNSLFPLGEIDRLSRVLQEAGALATALGDPTRQAWVSVFTSHLLWMTGRYAQALAAACGAEQIGAKCDDFRLNAAASYYVGNASFFIGDFQMAERALLQAIGLLASERFRERCAQAGYPSVMARWILTAFLAEQGRFAEAVEHGHEAVAMGEALEHPYSLAIACHGLAHVYAVKGQHQDAIAVAERGMALCRDWKIPVLIPLLSATLGLVKARAGETASAIALIEQALRAVELMKLGIYDAIMATWAAEIFLRADRVPDARAFADRALARARERGERAFEVLALEVLGHVVSHFQPVDAEAAEEHYRSAIAMAGTLSLRPVVARAHLGLGLLSLALGNRDRAEAQLATATALFRELGMPYWIEQAEAALREEPPR